MMNECWIGSGQREDYDVLFDTLVVLDCTNIDVKEVFRTEVLTY